MKIQRRFAFQFFTQLVALFLLLTILLFSLLIIFGTTIEEEDLASNLMTAEDFSYETHINEKYMLDAALKNSLRRQHIWLLVYDNDQQLKTSFNVPNDAPVQYKDLLKNDKILYNIEKIELNTERVTIIIGQKNNSAITLATLTNSMNWKSKTLPNINTDQLIYYLDANGQLLDTVNIKKAEASVEKIYNRQQYAVERYTEPHSGRQIIVATKNMEDSPLRVFKRMTPRLIILGIVSLLCFILFIYFYTRKFANPLLLFMEWIRQIGQKQYDMPSNKKGQPLFRTKKGRIRKRFKLYKDMVTTMETMSEELKQHEVERQQMEKMREEWIIGLSHDLKTPLSTIVGYTKMMRSGHHWTAEEQQQFLQVMDDKAIYMKELIDDLTLTYRLKNERMPLQLKHLEINEWLRRIVIQLMNTSANSSYTFDVVTNQVKIYAHIDPILFQRVIDNLLMNAMKHNPAHTTITIETKAIKGMLHIIVMDNGVGMDAQTVSQLFNRYYRGTTTTEHTEGTGLGMAITEQLVKLHQGSITVKSTPNIGTSIEIVIAESVSTTATQNILLQ